MNTLAQLIFIISSVAGKNLPMYFYNQVFILQDNEDIKPTEPDYKHLQHIFDSEVNNNQLISEDNSSSDYSFTSLKVQVPIFIGLILLFICGLIIYRKVTSYFAVIDKNESIVTISEIISTGEPTAPLNIAENNDEQVYENVAYYNDSIENLLDLNRKAVYSQHQNKQELNDYQYI